MIRCGLKPCLSAWKPFGLMSESASSRLPCTEQAALAPRIAKSVLAMTYNIMTEYTPDDLLPLSGIQHFLFCRRQWALIHVEQQWKENALTAEGRIMHKRADDPFFTETRNGVITARSVPIASYRLGLSGVCDVVEFTPSPPAPLPMGEGGQTF